MGVKIKEVRPEDFDAQVLLALAREGKLYMKVEARKVSEKELLARCQQEALEYVRAIDEYAADEWRPCINKVWEQLVQEPMIATGLVMAQKKCLNRYFLMSLVTQLQALGIYRPEGEVSVLQLSRSLEHTTQKNSVYKNRTQYPLAKLQKQKVREITDRLSKSLK